MPAEKKQQFNKNQMQRFEMSWVLLHILLQKRDMLLRRMLPEVVVEPQTILQTAKT